MENKQTVLRIIRNFTIVFLEKQDCHLSTYCIIISSGKLNNTKGMGFLPEREYYKKKIHEMIEKIDDEKSLRRIYKLVEYLYIHVKRLKE